MLTPRGIIYNLLYTNEVLGNVSGGVRQGPIHAGKFEAAISVDLDRLPVGGAGARSPTSSRSTTRAAYVIAAFIA